MEILIAPDGYVYALKSDNTIYGKRISLGINDSPDNWELIEEIIEEDGN
jgi:hypothetical protein